MSLFTDRIAEFSPCRKYRYWLEIVWDRALPRLGWLLLNPSTADEIMDDPAIRKCQGLARTRGYGGIIVCNVYALRSTDPKGLWEVDYPTGPENDAHLRRLIGATGRVIAGWGKNAKAHRIAEVLLRVPDLDCLKVNADGSPMHPLYIPYSRPFMPYARDGKRTP